MTQTLDGRYLSMLAAPVKLPAGDLPRCEVRDNVLNTNRPAHRVRFRPRAGGAPRQLAPDKRIPEAANCASALPFPARGFFGRNNGRFCPRLFTVSGSCVSSLPPLPPPPLRFLGSSCRGRLPSLPTGRSGKLGRRNFQSWRGRAEDGFRRCGR